MTLSPILVQAVHACLCQQINSITVVQLLHVSWVQGRGLSDCYATHRADSPGLPLYLELSGNAQELAYLSGALMP